MTSFDDVLAQAGADTIVREASCRILLRQDLAARHEQLDAETLEPSSGALADAPERVAKIEALAALEAEIEAARVTFRFKSIGYLRWQNLIRAHPPTRQQRTELGNAIDHNPETFPAAAMAACCFEPPDATVDAFRLLCERLPVAEFTALWSACVRANAGGSNPKSTAVGVIRLLNERSGNTPAGTESLAVSSSDE